MSAKICDRNDDPSFNGLLSSHSNCQDNFIQNYNDFQFGTFLGDSAVPDNSTHPGSLNTFLQPYSQFAQSNDGFFSDLGGYYPVLIDTHAVSVPYAPPLVFEGSHPIPHSSTSIPIHNGNDFAYYLCGINQGSSATEAKNNNAKEVDKRKPTKKKKPPLLPEAEEAKHEDFLQRNRIAGAKYRESNRRKWKGLQEQYNGLKTENKMLKAQWNALKEEVSRLEELLVEHEKCGRDDIVGWAQT